MPQSLSLAAHGLSVPQVMRNPSPASLYEEAIRHEPQAAISDTGALIAYSGEKTGRSPKDKRVVRHPDSEHDVWWGPVNFPLDERSFMINRERANRLPQHARRGCTSSMALPAGIPSTGSRSA